MDRYLEGMKRLPREERMKGYNAVDLIGARKPLDFMNGAYPIVVEFRDEWEPLYTFEHPDNAVYILGPEDGDVSVAVKKLAYRFIYIPTMYCLNLATAAAIIAYDRAYKEFYVPGMKKPWVQPIDLREYGDEIG